MDEVMTCVIAEGDRKRLFLTPTNEHIQASKAVEPSWRPNGQLPERALGFRVQRYGFTEWRNLFTERQLSGLSTFGDKLTETVDLAVSDGSDAEYANVPRTYLALTIGRMGVRGV